MSTFKCKIWARKILVRNRLAKRANELPKCERENLLNEVRKLYGNAISEPCFPL